MDENITWNDVHLIPVRNTLDKLYLYYKEKYIGVICVHEVTKCTLIRRGFEKEFNSFDALMEYVRIDL